MDMDIIHSIRAYTVSSIQTSIQTDVHVQPYVYTRARTCMQKYVNITNILVYVRAYVIVYVQSYIHKWNK